MDRIIFRNFAIENRWLDAGKLQRKNKVDVLMRERANEK